MDREILINIEGAGKVYSMGEVAVTALKPIELSIFAGELLVILGPSGSGKSTLLNLLGGIDQPTSGRLLYRGIDLSIAGKDQLTNYRRTQVGFVFQFYNLMPDLTAGENILLAADLVEDSVPVDQVLAEVGLTERKDHFPAQLSGGEQQRIALARAIVKKPPLLLCDEPTGALDYQSGIQILKLLASICEKRQSTVIIVTHNMAIGSIAHRIVRMRSGEVVEINENLNPISPERIEW